MSGIKIKKDGIKKRRHDSFDSCPKCKSPLKQIMSLYDQPNPPDLVVFAQNLGTMEATLYECSTDGIKFIEYEKGDYDWMVLEEIE